MISDFTIAEQVDSLQDYYNRIYELHATAHKPEYMLVHAEIIGKMEDCDSYTELGVNQGATLAAAMLQNPKKIRAYDISLKPYNFANKHFAGYAADNSIDYIISEEDTLKCVLDPVDLLYIDTLHRYDHLTKELERHGDKAKKYIVFHDTHAQQGLKQAVQEYVQFHHEWSIVTDCQDNVGFMTIQKRG